jgi:hypothetical protein
MQEGVSKRTAVMTGAGSPNIAAARRLYRVARAVNGDGVRAMVARDATGDSPAHARALKESVEIRRGFGIWLL